MNAIFVILLVVVSGISAEVYNLRAGNGLSVSVSTTDGAYSIAVDGQTWFTSGPTGVHSNKDWFKSGETLHLQSYDTSKGTDNALGTYQAINLYWSAGGVPFQTSFLSFADSEAIIFRQTFPQGLTGCSVGSSDDTVSSFPSLFHAQSSLYYLSFAGTFAYAGVGIWPTDFKGGSGDGVPIAFYNKNLRTLIFSPRNNFMVGVQNIQSALNGSLAFGLTGELIDVPSNFTYDTLLFAGQGINDTFYDWGQILLDTYGKHRTSQSADVIIQYLGYWTDNGAYYYYETEPGKNYEETMLDVGTYLHSINLPVQNYQFDSWWYYKGINDGVTLWETMPSVFPDGMEYLDQKLGDLPLTLHNRYFAPNNDYLNNYTFIVESFCALPIDENLFLDIMGKAKPWGMVVYEQDWLVTTYLQMDATRNNVSNARKWLLAMGNAASKLGVTVQYCMPLPIHLLQSVEIQSVTQSRATTDYQPGNDQWQIGHSSLLIWSLGVIPFKDDFWTTSNQTDCHYSNCYEPNPVLETLIAALSTGPVGPSDQIGKLDHDLVMRTTAQDGFLLKADKPATALDSTFLPQPNSPTPQLLHVYDTYSYHANHRWHYVIAAGLTESFTVYASDLLLSNTSNWLFDYFEFDNGSVDLLPFDDSHPLKISPGSVAAQPGANTPVEFHYYVIAPVLESGWVLLGETGKFVTASSQRFTSLTSSSGTLEATVAGSPGEHIVLALVNTKAKTPGVVSVATTLKTKSATLTCPSGTDVSCSFV